MGNQRGSGSGPFALCTRSLSVAAPFVPHLLKHVLNRYEPAPRAFSISAMWMLLGTVREYSS